MIRALLLLPALILSGCSAAVDDIDGTMPAPNDSAILDVPSILADGCQESQGVFPTPARDFPPDALPPGFSLVLDDQGLASIVTMSRSCHHGDSQVLSVLAVVLVIPPDALLRPDAEHGILLSLWTDSEPFFDALHGWNFTSAETRTIEIESTTEAGFSETRTRASPDFLLTLQTTGATEEAPHSKLRVFEIFERSITAIADADRESVQGQGGVATASFIMSPTIGDLPYHTAGTGHILAPDGFQLEYRQVGLPAIEPDEAHGTTTMRAGRTVPPRICSTSLEDGAGFGAYSCFARLLVSAQ